MSGFIHLSTNVGSLGEENSQVRKNLYEIIKLVQQHFGSYPDSFSIQECGNFDYRFSPFFGLPVATNDECLILQNGNNIRRGVCTYVYDTDNTIVFPTLFYDVEIVTTISNIIAEKSCLNLGKNKGAKTVQIAFINVYRNQTVVTEEKLKSAIEKTINECNGKYGCRKIVVTGDFNLDNFSIFGLSEIKHPDSYHKFEKNSGKRFIDKVFSNISNIKIAAVFQTAENKVQNEAQDLGHKVLAISIGEVKPPLKKSVFINRIFKKKCSEFKGGAGFDYQDLIDGGEEAIQLTADYLTEIVTNLVSDSFLKTSSSRKRAGDKRALEMIADNSKSNDPKKHKEFYRFIEEFKEGVNKADPIVPKLEAFHKKLETKLNTLNVGNPLLIAETVDKIYNEKYKGSVIVDFPSKKIAKKIVLSTSSSGARDELGLSLKQTKTFISRSALGWDMLYSLIKAMALTGFIPDSWKMDNISFLYKKKGMRSDPGNWRPITIAPSFGKHFEKIMLSIMKKVDDLNCDNHSYIENKSCITAILNVSEHLKTVREREKQLNLIGKRIVVVFAAEDISSAFESMDHGALDLFCKAVFDEKGSEVKIRKLIKSYLSRKSFVIDRETHEKLEIIKKFDDRATPQGSILSPVFWRIFDNLFSQIYKDGLVNLIIKNEFLDRIHHVAYADDHVSILSFVFDVDECDDFIYEIISITVTDARNLLDFATKSVGCGVNMKKSETLVSNKWILVAERWVNAKEKFKQEVTWLGYSLTIDDNHHLIFTDTKMVKRFQRTTLLMYDVFQYIESIHVRWKIYRVYICPVIEWYLPAIMTERAMKQDTFKPSTQIEIFQQKCLSEVLRVPHTVGRYDLNRIMGEKSVKQKVGLAATRLSSFCKRNLNSLKWKNGIIPDGTATRSGRNVQARWDGVEEGDLGDWMHMLAEQCRNEENYGSEDKLEKFDEMKAKIWAKEQNTRISGYLRNKK